MDRLYFITDIRKSDSSCKSYDGLKPYVATGDIFDNKIVSSELVSYEEKPSRANVICKKGDVLFAKMQSTIKVIQIDEETEKCIFSTGFYCFRDKRLLPELLKFYFRSKAFNSLKDKNCRGATMKAINDEGMKKISIPLYSLAEQEYIVDYLENIQSLIDASKKQLLYYDELIQSKFYELFGTISDNQFGYEKTNLGKYMTVIADFNANGGYEKLDSNVKMLDNPDYAWMVRVVDLESGDVSGRKYVDKKAYDLLSKSSLFGEELIMCKIGSAGKIYLMPKINQPATLARNAFLMRFDSNKIDMTFLFQMLSLPECANEISKKTQGAVTKTITKDAVKSIPILVPGIEKQRDFSNFVHEIDNLKALINKKLSCLIELLDKKTDEFFGGNH